VTLFGTFLTPPPPFFTLKISVSDFWALKFEMNRREVSLTALSKMIFCFQKLQEFKTAENFI